MSSDEDITKASHRPGPLRVIAGQKPEETADKRPTAFQQLRTITIPPILSWMAQRVGAGHGPWTSEFELEKSRNEKTEPKVGGARRLRWAGVAAFIVIAVGLVVALFLVLPTKNTTAPTTAPHAANDHPGRVTPPNALKVSTSLSNDGAPGVPAANHRPTTIANPIPEARRKEPASLKIPPASGTRASDASASKPAALDDPERTF